MIHGQEYHAVVIAIDQTGGCMMEMTRFTVDVTPPQQGKLITGADFGKVLHLVLP